MLAMARSFADTPPRTRSIYSVARHPGAVAEWLRSGLQSRVHQFDSGRRLLIALETHGQGEPLVLVHGLATSRVIWRRVVPMLPGRLVVVDVPGFGASPPVGEGFDPDALADGIGDARFDLVGHSLGGALSIGLAHRHRARVRSLVLVAPAGLRAA